MRIRHQLDGWTLRHRHREIDGLAGAVEKMHALKVSRRKALQGGLGLLAGMLVGEAMGLLGGLGRARADQAVKTGRFIFPRLEFSVSDETSSIWNVGPVGDANLRQKLRELTNINVSDEARAVHLRDLDDLCKNPYVFMTSEGHFKLTETEQKNLREFLERGGFIHADDCVYPAAKGKIIPSDIGADSVVTPRTPGDPADIDRFFRDYVLLINKLFPDNPMRRIPPDHELFHVYYDFKEGCPHLQGVKHGAFALFEPGTGRMITIATPGDLHCGWMNIYWTPAQNLEAMKMGINIIIYYLSH